MIDALEAPPAVEPDVITEGGGDVASTAPTVEQQSKRRFTIATIVGTAVVAPIYLWVLWDLWTGKINALRSVAPNNFYELQARAMFSGQLNVPTGSLGIEGFLQELGPADCLSWRPT